METNNTWPQRVNHIYRVCKTKPRDESSQSCNFIFYFYHCSLVLSTFAIGRVWLQYFSWPPPLRRYSTTSRTAKAKSAPQQSPSASGVLTTTTVQGTWLRIWHWTIIRLQQRPKVRHSTQHAGKHTYIHTHAHTHTLSNNNSATVSCV